MVISRTNINFLRLLAAAPRQQNQAKLVHYVATLRQQFEQLAEETTSDGLPKISKDKLSEYSQQIEAIASKLENQECQMKEEEDDVPACSVLKRRSERPDPVKNAEASMPAKLDAAEKAHMEKHRKLQEDLTDEMVELARELKQRTRMIGQSLSSTMKILDSTETAVEQSLASTGRANMRAREVHAAGSKTTCFTWLVAAAMLWIFVLVLLLIRIT